MTDIIWTQSYSPAEAERGKFVPIDSTTITDYPSAGRGKYALLTYSVTSSGSPMITETSNTSYANTLWNGTTSFPGDATVYSPTLPGTLLKIEIQNKSSGAIYFMLSATGYENTRDSGIELLQDGYYSIHDIRINSLTVASLSGGSVRIQGHYIS